MKLTDIPHLESLAAKNTAILIEASEIVATLAELERLRNAVERLENQITVIMDEFGDNPAECLLLIGEYISLCQHYRANPGASREGEL